jgi:hypothetical protein
MKEARHTKIMWVFLGFFTVGFNFYEVLEETEGIYNKMKD